MEDSTKKASNICRLCLETLNTNTLVGIDVSTVAEVSAMVKAVYLIEVFATDQHRSICIPCYKRMLTHYKNVVHYRNKKRIVQMNNAMLNLMAGGAHQEDDAVPTEPTDDTNIRNDSSRERSTSATNKEGSVIAPAAKETSNTNRVASPTLPTEQNNNTHKNSVTKSAARKMAIGTESVSSGKNRSSKKEKKKAHESSVEQNQSFSNPSKSGAPSSSSTAQRSDRRNEPLSSDNNTVQKAPEKVPEKTSEKAPEMSSEKAAEKSSEKAAEKFSEKATEKSTEKASRKQQDTVAGSSLIPVVLVNDCLTHPDYLKALFPLKISLSLDDVKPQEYLCDSCFLAFKAEDEYRNHLRRSCTRACRYCYAKIDYQHQCAFSSKYSNLYPSINAIGKYCSKEKENAGTHKENEISEYPQGPPSKLKPDDQNLTSSATTKKSGQDKSCKKVSRRAGSNSGSSISSRPVPGQAQFALSSGSSSESSVERSIFIDSESDEEMKTLVIDLKRKMKKKKRTEY